MKQVVWQIPRAWLFRRNPQLQARLHKWSLTDLFSRPQLSVVGTALVWSGSLLLVAWIVSGWIWDQAAPSVASLPTTSPIDPVAASQGIAARHLMGERTTAQTGTDEQHRGAYRLLGLMTASRGLPGFAILVNGGKESLVVVEGEEIVPGLTLLEVLPDQVVIGREGQTETITLD
jgi:hypothetical protein